ncbi:MAG: hypothetical protein ACD_72C00462G0004 [uncultured bacterium]|nr:MAG: hypothetical protein ACD_72C00462G0004 [uncultured bacterium]
METRLATIEDKQAVLNLLEELSDEVNEKIGSSTKGDVVKIGNNIFEEIINRTDTHIFLAIENNEVVGLATFYLLPNIRHNWHRGHIEDFIIGKKMRGSGIGSKLIETIKDFCKQNNIKVFKLDSANELRDAHNFYRKNGGRQTEQMFRFDI